MLPGTYPDAGTSDVIAPAIAVAGPGWQLVCAHVLLSAGEPVFPVGAPEPLLCALFIVVLTIPNVTMDINEKSSIFLIINL